MERRASRRWEHSALSVNGEAQTSGSVVTIAELKGGEGRASMSKGTFEIDAVNGVGEVGFDLSRKYRRRWGRRGCTSSGAGKRRHVENIDLGG